MVTAVRAEAIITAKNQLRPGLNSAARELEKFRSREKAGMAAFSSTAAKALGAVGGAFSAIEMGRRAFTSSVSMERKMYDVQRATDASSDALKAQEKYLLDLARQTGKTKEELADMYAAAGFAGRPARELGQFTEYASKATVAWGTNAQETGQALAEIGNIYEANQTRIEAIGDAINSVADSSASSEKDLIEILRRVGGAGKIVGISAENMLAFGAALKEVGVGTEVASTGLNAMLTKISVPDDDFDDALKLAGLKPKQFRKNVEKNATGAILELLAALKKLEGTKRISVLKDLFGMEYADDIARLVGATDRIVKLLGIANDKTKTLGSVRAGFTIALEKDFNRLDRAAQSIDVVVKRVGDSLKEVAGGFAETINKAVDASEKARERVGRLDEIDRQADERAGKPKPAPAPASEDPLSWEAMNRRARESIADPRTDDSSLYGLALYGGTDEIKAVAEEAYRRRRLAAGSREGMNKESSLFGSASSLMAKSLLAGPEAPASLWTEGAIAEWEKLRLARMQKEFSDMGVIAQARQGSSAAGLGLGGIDRMASFGNLPVTIGKGKTAKTFEAPKLDMASAGAGAGDDYTSALNASLDRGIAEAMAKIEQLKRMLRFSTSATIKIEIPRPQGVGLGGFNTGFQGPN